jgi:hypothetical protein
VSEDQVFSQRPAKSFILEAWKIASHSDQTGSVKLCLCGLAFGNDLPLRGENVRTSAIVSYQMDGNSLVIFTQSGSEYKLGMRDTPQEQDKQRLTRYLDRISSRGRIDSLQAASDATNILGTQGGRPWQEQSWRTSK